MSSWFRLYADHRDVHESTSDWPSAIRKRLKKLSETNHCENNAQWLFTGKEEAKRDNRKGRSPTTEWRFSPCVLPLVRIPYMSEASLDIKAMIDRNEKRLLAFSLVVTGKREDNTTFTLAVHLEDDTVTEKNRLGDRKGQGACGHAAFHCHVGPDLDTEPKVRVPMPAISTIDALDWVLSQAIPVEEFEPAPWSELGVA